jgi:hypothetical protein
MAKAFYPPQRAADFLGSESLRHLYIGSLFAVFLHLAAIPVFARQAEAVPAQGEHEASATAKGVAPRPSAADYAVHAELQGVEVGATQLTPDEVRKTFVTDLNSCCLVFEVALYPAKWKSPEVALKDFTYRVVGTDTAIKPSSPGMLALTLQLVSRARTDFTPHGSVGVVYDTGGYDPATGQMRGRGVGTSADVSLGAGQSGARPTEGDRELMQTELSGRSLPEGKLSTPVAGYLYFYLTKKVKKKRGARQLEYTLAGQKVALTLD